MANTSALHRYALALGSNRAQSAARPPRRLLAEAAILIAQLGKVQAIAPVITTLAIGPSLRDFVNGALIIESALGPEAMLRALQMIEKRLGRRRHRRWGARRMDIDIILWSGGRWNSRSLRIPHPHFRTRAFVLTPLRTIAATWRDPVSGLTVRQLHARSRKATALPPARG